MLTTPFAANPLPAAVIAREAVPEVGVTVNAAVTKMYVSVTATAPVEPSKAFMYHLPPAMFEAIGPVRVLLTQRQVLADEPVPVV